MTPTRILTASVATLITAGFAPVIPSEMTFELAYQNPISAQVREIPEQVTATGTIAAKRITPPKIYTDDNGNGIYSVAVFRDRNGNKVEIQIPDELYADMGKAGGYAQNPKRDEYLSLFEVLTTVEVAEAAIAFDNYTSGLVVGASSLTYAHTVSGSNRILFVAARIAGGGGLDLVTGITYNGVALTRDSFENCIANCSGQGQYIYHLVAPATGANNVVVSLSASDTIHAGAASYTGASQTGQPDSNNKTTCNATTSCTLNFTTVADNSWTIVYCGNSGVSITGGAHKVGNITGGAADIMADSNAAITPAGSTSLQCSTGGGSAGWTLVGASFSPSTGGGGSTFNPMYFFEI